MPDVDVFTSPFAALAQGGLRSFFFFGMQPSRFIDRRQYLSEATGGSEIIQTFSGSVQINDAHFAIDRYHRIADLRQHFGPSSVRFGILTLASIDLWPVGAFDHERVYFAPANRAKRILRLLQSRVQFGVFCEKYRSGGRFYGQDVSAFLADNVFSVASEIEPEQDPFGLRQVANEPTGG